MLAHVGPFGQDSIACVARGRPTAFRRAPADLLACQHPGHMDHETRTDTDYPVGEMFLA